MLFDGERFDDSIERTKAKLLIHAIKGSPGGYKLSFEVTLWLALNFEDAYLPGDAQSMAAMVHDAWQEYIRHDDEYYLRKGEIFLVQPLDPSLFRRILRVIERCWKRYSSRR